MTTFSQILNKFRKEALSERDKGFRFERLMQAYLQTTSIYESLFETIWLWTEFPYKDQFGGKDIGYVKAFRWATNRLEMTNAGVIGFVTNGAWIDSNGLDGMRKCFEKEFSSIYVFNLRGNQRTSGELSRKEGGKIFGSGSRTPIAITILVKKGGIGNEARG